MFETPGSDLWSSNSYALTAGGNFQLADCGFDYVGKVIGNADVEFVVTELGGYDRLNIRVEGVCDTVLLVADAFGDWHYSDDANGLDPSIDIIGGADGRYDVWVGTIGTEYCDAALVLETF